MRIDIAVRPATMTKTLVRLQPFLNMKKCPKLPKKYCVALDTETTGVAFGKDEVVQLSIICFQKVGENT